jgi:hypothetical protein
VEPGDLIQVSLWRWSAKDEKLERQDDGRWIWVGFRTKDETPFHSIDPRLVSAFVGLKEGGDLRFLESTNQNGNVAGHVYVNPFGNLGAYSKDETGTIYAGSEYTGVHVNKVFKGQLKYRTTRLYDDTWYWHNSSFLSYELIDTPRIAWIDEARFEGVSADGKRAIYRSGPERTPGKGQWGAARVTNYWPLAAPKGIFWGPRGDRVTNADEWDSDRKKNLSQYVQVQ